MMVEKNMSFKVEDDNTFLKYNKIWGKIKITLNIKFHNFNLCIMKNTKVKIFNDVINTVFFKQ